MSSGLLTKASFVLLLLIFGCLVYIIARDRRLDQIARDTVAAGQVAEERAIPASTSIAPQPGPGRADFAPLRPRTNPAASHPAATSRPAPAQPVRSRVEPTLVSVDRPVAPQVTEAPAAGATYAAFAGTSSGGAVGSPSPSTVSGQVFFRGTPPREAQIALDPACGRLHAKPITTRHYVLGDDGGLANVFVYVKSGSVSIGPPVAQSVLLDQVGCEYQPYIVGVQVNQPLIVRNSDPLMHNVHAMPKNSRERNVAQPKRGMTATFSFQRPEVFVRFKCDVHPWMFAYVGVVDHPWFAVTDKDGKFTLPPGLGTGTYTLAAAHPKGGELTQQISVSSDAAEPVIFTFNSGETLAAPAPISGQARR